MTTQNQYSWRREKEGLGLWEHRGKVAITGYGHSPIERRWDGTSMDATLGAYTILACQRAMDDAGVTLDEVDGIVCFQDTISGPAGGAVSNWAPRPYFDPPYDSEWGLTRVNPEWLIKQMGFKNIKYAPANVPHIGEQMGLAAQSVGDGLCNTCLVIYPAGNLEGRYRRGGVNAEDYAAGGRQWSVPWGNHGGNDFINIFPHNQYCQKYGGKHDDLAPFVVNQHKNGRLTPWGYYTNHEPYQITVQDYLDSRFILRPLRIWDCDRPVNASAAYLFTTAERAKDMKQAPVYVLNHTQDIASPRSSHTTLDEIETFTDRAARMVFEGSGLSSQDVDIFNPYDGFAIFTQFFLEAFRWHGVKRGEAFDFFADDISVKGPHPFCSGGGNLGNGRTRTAMYTDSIEQLRGTAGARQVTVRAENAICGFALPLSGGWLALSKNPS
ncbi:MAG: thiolase family protein [Dehalococcoidia bacterium]